MSIMLYVPTMSSRTPRGLSSFEANLICTYLDKAVGTIGHNITSPTVLALQRLLEIMKYLTKTD